MRKVLVWFAGLQLIVGFAHGQRDQTADYVNQTFYNKRLSLIRTGYDRWNTVATMIKSEGHISELNSHFYSTVNDFNFGQDKNGKGVYPMMAGYALGWPWGGVYFLGYTTDFANFFRKDSKESDGYFKAVTIGANVDLRLLTLQADATVANGTTSLYAKSFVIPLRTFVGAGLSKFDVIRKELTPIAGSGSAQHVLERSNASQAAGLRQIVKTGAYAVDMMEAGTTWFRYFNTGIRYFRLVKARYVPNISSSWHQLVDHTKWEDMRWDAEIFYESRGESLGQSFLPKDYEVRVTIFRFLGDASDAVSNRAGTKAITWRPAAFVAASYKSKEDGISETLTESGQAYTGEHGLGGEVGIGFRVLGFKSLGFQEDTYVKLSYFYNYSQYFERFPAMTSGVKFRVVF